MRFVLAIDVDNAAFDDDNLGNEVARILRKLADGAEGTTKEGNEDASGPLYDINGNRVGSWHFENE